jgi:molybdopterin molybdotransferase
MIEVKEAVQIINKSIVEFPTIKIPLEKALGRVLRQTIIADTDFPPFDRVMMDGIAIRYEDFNNGLRTFNIQGVQAAGAEQMKLKNTGSCLEVMTGAVAPEYIDLVIPYEQVDIDVEKCEATVNSDGVKKVSNIHLKGTDKKKGELLIDEGKVIGTPEIAVAASVGMTELEVTKNPSIAIISTGDELVEINEKPLSHQIRRSNVYAIAAELKHFGIKTSLYHFNDEKEKLKNELEKVLKSHDVIIMSGGVSKGKFDFVPETLENLGVKKLFHRIQQKPGKPFWFGKSEDRKVVFAFPGNPVSTFLCYHKYFVPWLRRSLKIKMTHEKKDILGKDFSIKTIFTYFLQVETSIDENGQVIATPKVGKGSGDHANLLSSDAFLELPGNSFEFKKGRVFNLISFRNT